MGLDAGPSVLSKGRPADFIKAMPRLLGVHGENSWMLLWACSVSRLHHQRQLLHQTLFSNLLTSLPPPIPFPPLIWREKLLLV